MSVRIVFIMIVMLFNQACATGNQADFESLMERIQSGSKFSKNLTFDYYRSGKAGTNVKEFKKDGRFHFEYNYFGSKCRIGVVYEPIDDLHIKRVDWYYISGREYCRVKSNWRGPF